MIFNRRKDISYFFCPLYTCCVVIHADISKQFRGIANTGTLQELDMSNIEKKTRPAFQGDDDSGW